MRVYRYVLCMCLLLYSKNWLTLWFKGSTIVQLLNSFSHWSRTFQNMCACGVGGCIGEGGGVFVLFLLLFFVRLILFVLQWCVYVALSAILTNSCFASILNGHWYRGSLANFSKTSKRDQEQQRHRTSISSTQRLLGLHRGGLCTVSIKDYTRLTATNSSDTESTVHLCPSYLPA